MKIIPILFIISLTLQMISFIVWFFNIGSYLRENGKRTLKGANYGATFFNDLGQIIELYKENKEIPKFVTASLAIQGLSILLFAISYFSQY